MINLTQIILLFCVVGFLVFNIYGQVLYYKIVKGIRETGASNKYDEKTVKALHYETNDYELKRSIARYFFVKKMFRALLLLAFFSIIINWFL
ncbi:hypothetical protein RCC89_09315 [Cytophagaceae bacterium ABcell3]|nr:hypothetical protein RCC89_09315 [Cytophagaceae bacterium ABcell3]